MSPPADRVEGELVELARLFRLSTGFHIGYGSTELAKLMHVLREAYRLGVREGAS